MPFEKYGEIFRLGWPYAILMLGSSTLSDEVDGVILNIVFFGFMCFTGVLGVVSCHQIFLSEQEMVSELRTLRWRSNETMYFISAVVLGFLASLMMIPFIFMFVYLDVDSVLQDPNSIFVNVIYAVMFIPVAYVTARWSLILPHAALGTEPTLSWAWNISKGFGANVFILVGLVPLLTSIALSTLIELISPSYFLNVVIGAVSLIVIVIELCFLSLSYRWLTFNASKVDNES